MALLQNPHDQLGATVLDALSHTQRLPSLSPDVRRIVTLLDDPDCASWTLAELIFRDQSLSTEILKLVNSSLYGLRRRVSSIQHAIALLGFSAMRSLVMSHSVSGIIAREFPELQDHSLAAARAALWIAQRVGIEEPDRCYTAGLIHDLGKVIVVSRMKAEYARIRAVVCDRGCLMRDAEAEILGCDHADIGAWLLDRWRLPPALICAVAGHHRFGTDTEEQPVTAAVHLADVLVRAECFGWAGDPTVPVLEPLVLEVLNLETDDLEQIMKALPGLMDSIERCWRTS